MTKKILCVGDSLTAGRCSYDWVSCLKKTLKPAGYTVVNKGIDGETSTVLKHRIKWDVVDPNPALVVIQIGGNDLIGSLHKGPGEMYVKLAPAVQKSHPTVRDYETSMASIIDELDISLPKETHVLVLSPPPIGEGGEDSQEWKTGETLSGICKRLVDESSDRIHFRNLYEVVKQDMIKAQCNYPFTLSLRKMDLSHMLSNIVSWKTVRWINGYKYTSEGLHFCKEFGDICQEIIAVWVLSLPAMPAAN